MKVSPMKNTDARTSRIDVSIVSKSEDGWHVQEILRELKARNIRAEVIDFDRTNQLSEEMNKLGKVTLWRASQLPQSVQRSSVANYLDITYMINEAVFLRAGASEKFYQQQTIASQKALTKYAIPTYNVAKKTQFSQLIETGKLTFPVIAKPNNGSRGEGIVVVKTRSDIDTLELPLGQYVLQDFMANDGDWRVIVVGGRALGAMKRIAPQGSYLNNISQGATAIKEIDPTVLSFLYDIAPKVAALFRLRFCGVDIIKDTNTGTYHIIEVNTAPQWNGEYGFESVTGVRVGAEVAEYMESLLCRAQEKMSVVDQVDEYYKRNIGLYSAEKFHYASRLWLWTGDEWSRKILDDARSSYIGSSSEEYRVTLDSILARKDNALSVNQNKAYRKKYFEAFRMLPIYNALLFRVLFCDSVYDLDIRPYVKELIPDKEFIGLFRELLADQDAIRVLSTHAINFFYLLKNYYKFSVRLSSMVLVDPYEIVTLAGDYSDLVNRKILMQSDALKLKIYVLTHAILGESRFYQRSVRLQAFKEMCREIEKVISDNYFDVSLDNKCEFLVCAKICGYKTHLKKMIMGEAEKSLSWSGQFIVDADASAVRHVLRTSEHRNVLYIMASRERGSMSVQKAASLAVLEKRTIGRLAKVTLPDFHNMRLIARIDTGATRSSVSVSEIEEKNGAVSFVLFDAEHPLYDGEKLTFHDYKVVKVKNAGVSELSYRYVVPIRLAIDGDERIVECNLAERQHMHYPILIGRDFLRDGYIVDTSRQFVNNSRR